MGEGQDELDALRHELADLNAAIESGDAGPDVLGRVEELERMIAERQNPVEPARELVGEQGEVIDPASIDPEDFKPAGADLVAASPDDEHGAFLVLDRHVEGQIIEEFQRRALKVMLYDVPKGGGRAIDLSYAGVNEGVRLLNWMGGQRIGIVQGSLEVITEHYDVGDGLEPHFVATVMAVNETIGYQQYGTASEPQWMQLKDSTVAKYRREGKRVREDGKVFDVFARAKAINKAQRNALKVQIPETMRQTLIAQYKGDANALLQIQAGAGAAAIAEMPAPLTDEKAQRLNVEARRVYEEIRGYAPGGVKVNLLPAVFAANLSRAQHDHALLEELIVRLQAKLEEAKGLAA